MKLRGYPVDEIDNVAKDLIQLICELSITTDLAMLGLCRSIVMIGSQEDLDMACREIDELSEIPFDVPKIVLEEEE